MKPNKTWLEDYFKLILSTKILYDEILAEIENSIYILDSSLIVLKDYHSNYKSGEDKNLIEEFTQEGEYYRNSIDVLKILIEDQYKRSAKLTQSFNSFKQSYQDMDELAQEQALRIISNFRFNIEQNLNRFNSYVLQFNMINIEKLLTILETEFNLKKYQGDFDNIIRTLSETQSKSHTILKEMVNDSQTFVDSVKNFRDKADDYLQSYEENPIKDLNEIDFSNLDESLLACNFDTKKYDTEIDFVEEKKISQLVLSLETAIDSDKMIIKDGGEDKDGTINLKINRNGIFIKITPAYNNGKPITARSVIHLLSSRRIETPDMNTLTKILNSTGGDYYKISDYKAVPDNEGSIEIEIKDNHLFAYMQINPPIYNAREIDEQDVKQTLEKHNIKYGIKQEVIEEVLREKIFSTYILIAQGTPYTPPVDGRFDFYFNTNLEEVNLKQDKYGNVNHRELNLIQNVASGRQIAKKMSPIPGKPGKNIHGEPIAPPLGKEPTINLGKNVSLSQDGQYIIATHSGHAQLIGNTISVEQIYMVHGDVDYSTGNIHFMGSVLVKGNVLDGFNIEASGDIEIHGTVGRCNIIGENNILIHQGIYGKNEGTIKSGGDIYAKFIDNAKLFAGRNVIIHKEILNSEVVAKNKIQCKGKRSSIVGGKLYAGEQIAANVIGNDNYITTSLEINISPEILISYNNLNEEKIKTIEEIKKLNQNYNVLKEKERRLRGNLPLEQKKRKAIVVKSLKIAINTLKDLNEEIKKLKEMIDDHDSEGSILIYDSIYPEVSININNAFYKNTSRMRKVQFTKKSRGIDFRNISIKEERTDAPKTLNLKTASAGR